MKPIFTSRLYLVQITAWLMLCITWGAVAQAKQSAVPVAALKSNVPYTIRKGDTLQRICRQYSVSATDCKRVAFDNQLENTQLPKVGSVLYIPLDVLPSKPQSIRVIQTAGKVTVAGQAVRANTRFEEKKEIKVAANSSAVIEMADGSRAKFLPNSVAEVMHSRQYKAPEQSTGGKIISWVGSKIRLIQGALETSVKKAPSKRHGTPMEVETTTSLLGVRGTRFRVAAADKYVPFDRAEVLEGEVSNTNTWRYATINVPAGQGAVVNPNTANLQAVALLPAPAVPKPDHILRRPQAYWEFSPVAGAVAYRVIAAYDADFNTVVYSHKSSTPKVDLGQLANGKWHVRARAVDAAGLEGLDATTSVELRQPAWVLFGASVNAEGSRPYLAWTAVTNARQQTLKGKSTVTVVVARDAKFNQPIATVKTSSNQVTLPHMPAGKYYLRVGVDNASIKNDERQIFKLEMPYRKNLGYNLLLRKLS